MIWICLCVLFVAARAVDMPSDAVTVAIERIVDLSSQIVKVTTNYAVTNIGKSRMSHFTHLVTDEEQIHLAYISASEENKEEKCHVTMSSISGLKKGFTAYIIELPDALLPNAKVSISVEYMLTEFLVPLPAQITQSDVQFIVYTGNAHVASLYSVMKETSVFVLPAGKLLSYSMVSPSKAENGKIIYGPYTNQQPFAYKEIQIHTENNSPFVVATKVERSIEISHWGNIAVEENIYLLHKGAELVGPFSRLDFQLDRRGSKRPIVTQYKTLLPSSAKDIYYRDEIGNISTSAVRRHTDAVEVTIQPRFPLFGGWKTEYVLGYNIPAYQYLYSLANNFALKMRLIDHLFDNVVVEHLKVRIILPEGSKNFKLVTPYSVKRNPDELHFTYLDTTGRPVVVLEKDNLVDAHIQAFTLYYEFDRLQLWREPLIAVAAFATIFLVIIVYMRFDFTIVSDAATENRLQAQSQIEQVTDLHVDRLRLYDQFDDAANKFKTNKDVAVFTAAKKKAENELKTVTQSIADAQVELKASNAEISDKLNEIQKLNKVAVDNINSYLVQVDRYVNQRLQKTTFVETERAHAQKMSEIKEKMDAIIYAL